MSAQVPGTFMARSRSRSRSRSSNSVFLFTTRKTKKNEKTSRYSTGTVNASPHSPLSSLANFCFLLNFLYRTTVNGLFVKPKHRKNMYQIRSQIGFLAVVVVFVIATFGTSGHALQFPQLFPPTPQRANAPKVERVSAGPIEISSLGCGTWSWGNRLLFDYDTSMDEEIYQSYRAVRAAGVSVFDTADSYGTLDLNGRAEILLGQFERRFLQETEEEEKSQDNNGGNFLFGSGSTSPPIVSQQVATKIAPYPWRITRGSMVSAARESLKRLKQDKLAIAQTHWSTSKYQPFQEGALWEGLADIYDEGLCEAVGVSNYGPQQLQKVSARMKERNVPLATAQIQYSLMTYKDCKDMNPVCDEEGVRLISYSPLCLGLLTGKYDLDNLPKSNARKQLFRELLPGAQGLLNTLEVIAKDVDKTQSQVAINWAICKGTVPIPGVRTLEMAEENLAATGWSLSAGAVDELDRAASNVGKPMIQNIFQTK